MLPYLDLSPQRAVPAAPGSIVFRLTEEYGNTFVYDRYDWDHQYGADITYDLDADTSLTTLSVEIGLVEPISAGIEVPFIVHYAGIMDPLIQGFHFLFGFPNAGREYAPEGRFRLRLEDRDGAWLDQADALAGFGEPSIFVKYQFIDIAGGGGGSVVSAVEFPLCQSNFFHSNGGIDILAALLGEFHGADHSLYAHIGGVYFYPPEQKLLQFNPWNLVFALSWEWRILKNSALYLQASGHTSPYILDHPRLSGISANTMVGMRWRFADHHILQLGIEEEFFTFATTDFEVVLAIETQQL